MDIKSPDVVFLGSTFEESDPRVIDGRSGEDGSRGGDGRAPDPELGVHEKGSFHGRTPDPEPPSPRRDGPEVPVEGVPVPRTDRDRG